MALAIGLAIGAYVLLYSGFKGFNPLETIASTFTGKTPEAKLTLTSSAAPTAARGKTGGKRAGILTVDESVKQGPDWVYLRVLQAASAAGGKYRVTSWHRPGARVRGTGGVSDHSCAKALDVVPLGGWHWGDALATEALRLGLRVVFRGDGDHDPALGAAHPHVHVSVGRC